MIVPTIRHASVLLPASEWGPGLPVLSMRRPWRWAKLKVERASGLWIPDSAPSQYLLDRIMVHDIDWQAFEAEYRAEMHSRSRVLDKLLRFGAAAPHYGLVLLCWEQHGKDGTVRCHRTILADMLRDRAASRAG